MKLKMTIDEAIAFADEWSRGMTIHEDSQGWRVVCMLLADEVRKLRSKGIDASIAPPMRATATRNGVVRTGTGAFAPGQVVEIRPLQSNA